jgi:hypothetical protein
LIWIETESFLISSFKPEEKRTTRISLIAPHSCTLHLGTITRIRIFALGELLSQFLWPAALQQLTGFLAGWYLGADGDGALCRDDRSTARRLYGRAGYAFK